jgi:hypothetical protein
VTLQALFHWNPNAGDDGWYIDDLRLTQTSSSSPTVRLDTDNNGSSACGVACSSITADLDATPTNSAAPGQLVTLSAQGSLADACVSGTLLYQFWLNPNNNATLSVADGDTLLRDYSANPIYEDAPGNQTIYGVAVKCSQSPFCEDTQSTTVGVTCTGSLTSPGPPPVYQYPTGWPKLTFTSKTALKADSGSATQGDFMKGNLVIAGAGNDLRDTPGNLAATGQTCLSNDDGDLQASDAAVPALGEGLYYLYRNNNGTICNEVVGSWRTFVPKELNGAGAGNRDQDLLGGVCTP